MPYKSNHLGRLGFSSGNRRSSARTEWRVNWDEVAAALKGGEG